MSRKAPVINVMATAAAKGVDPPPPPSSAPPSAPAPPSSPAPASDATAFLSGLPAPSFDLAAIVRDPRAQPRVELNTDTVEAYRELMAEAGGWGPFPAVIVFGPTDGRYYLADGFHRLAAAEAARVQSGRAEVRPGGLREAILHSVGANATHGLRRTSADKRRAVVTLLSDPDWSKKSDRWIAEKAAVSHMTVGRVRAELESTGTLFQSTERVGRDGRILDTFNIGRKSPELLPTETKFQSADAEAPQAENPTPEAPSAVRSRRAARGLAAIEGALEAVRDADAAEGKLATREVQSGVAALLSWAAGGDGKKARAFLRKLGARPPKDM